MDGLIDFGYVANLTRHTNSNKGTRLDPTYKTCTTHEIDPEGCPRSTEHIDSGVES